MKPKVMLAGAGDLGGVLLELLAREPAVGQLVVADRDEARGQARVNLARLGAMAQGFDPSIEFAATDLNDEARTAELLARSRPDLVVTTASPQTWWLPDLLPPEARARIRRAGYGMWLPVNLSLSWRLMRAVRMAGFDGPTIIGPYPDLANCMLAGCGLAPTVGLGNIDEIVPKVRWQAARRLGVPTADIRVWLVAHHAVEPPAFGGVTGPLPPHLIRIEHCGRDVTDEVDGSALLFEPLALPSGPVTHFLTAGSAVRLIRALVGADPVILHAPGPAGLPGGYPVAAGGGRVEVALPPGFSIERAIEVNEAAHRLDGIDRVEADGTAVFCPETIATLDEVLGYRCERLAPDQAGARAGELMARFREYARRHGVDVDARPHR